MSNIYTDYLNKIAINVPERYIDVKTGESYAVAAKIRDQIEYHADNSTLSHLVFSALHHYLSPKPVLNGGNPEILQQLAEIKSILEHGSVRINPASTLRSAPVQTNSLNMKEVEEVLEAFGG